MLQDVAPRWFRRTRSYAARIQVRPILLSIGAWDSRSRQVEIDKDYLCSPDRPIAQIAATIVHELTHARIAAAGIGATGPRRIRVERACIRQQLEFARRLPPGADADVLVTRYKQAFADVATLYGWEGQEDRRRLAAINMGLPKWLLSATTWLRRRRFR